MVESRPQVVSYEVRYRGSDLRKLKKFIMEKIKRKGLRIIGEMVVSGEKEGKWEVGVRVESGVGII